MRVTMTDDERWPTLVVSEAKSASEVENGYDVPDHLVQDLRLAHHGVTIAEQAIARHVQASGQDPKGHFGAYVEGPDKMN